ncbi:MAG: nucleotidyltransferase substrate binding protein [Sulfuritalea sp.]|nr:nucleotidyltransferase substrate binding protein [Sulfuritalea sp.]
MTQDIRWKQRFDNYCKAFLEFKEGIDLAHERPLTKLEKQGVIQGFEYTHELAWNVLKDYLEYQGIVGLIGSRDTTREAFKRGLIGDGEIWMDMIKSRNLTSHAYDQAMVEKILAAILSCYCAEFQKLHGEFAGRQQQES